MSDMELYRGQRDTVDGWAELLPAVGQLAQRLAATDFVPEPMRGKPAAVAAAILAGREMGIGPMTALQNIYVVHGKPGQSAQLMRSLVLAAGHSIRFVETTDTRCVVEGRRLGEDEWERVTFNADQARRARIDLGQYPEDKLVARASSRLCRRKFPDCLAGMAYSVEELEDGDPDAPAPIAAPPASPVATRTARRRVEPTEVDRATTAPHVVAVSRAEHAAAERDEVPAPALTPPEPGPPAEPVEPEQAEPDRRPVTRSQLTKLHATFNDVGVDDRGERLSVASSVLRRDLTSSSELTRAEAGALIDVLDTCLRQESPLGALYDLLAATDAPAEEGDAS